MTSYTEPELGEARRAIVSTINKCEKERPNHHRVLANKPPANAMLLSVDYQYVKNIAYIQMSV